MERDFEYLRSKMVDEQLIPRGICSASVLNAMRYVPRHQFVPDHLQKHAYEDTPLPIGLEQTISQPYIVAYMTEQIEPFPGMKVLEIGTGSGYQTAILAYLNCDVYSIELVKEHYDIAINRLSSYDNVTLKHGNGYAGWIEMAPFDAIIVTAASDFLPLTLIEQLKDPGKMIIPIGDIYFSQWLKLITKLNGELLEKELLPVRFVPMIK